MAEGVGFEPTTRLLGRARFSKPLPWTARPTLLVIPTNYNIKDKMVYNLNMNIRKIGQMVGFNLPDRSQDQNQDQISPAEKKPEEPMRILLEWEAPSRVEVGSLSNKFSRPFLIIGVVLILLLAVMREFWIILFVVSLFFFIEVLSKSRPQNAKYQISNKGIKYDEVLYTWGELKSFYFFSKGSSEFLGINTSLGLPSRIFISIIGQDRAKLKSILEKYLDYLKEEPKTFLDTTYDKIVDKFDI